MFSNCIAKGMLEKRDKSKVDYTLMHGLDLVLSQKCDINWGTYNLKNLEYIRNNIPHDQHGKIINSLQAEDYHWNWFKKSLYFAKDGYEWFYLLAEDDIQGMCLTYQPKDSIINSGQIYYIEYLAVAPWNRNTLLSDRKYLKVASILLSKITKFLNETKGLTPAFSLHSLPQATGFYEYLGMEYCPNEDKDGLHFYEIPLNNAQRLMEVHQ